MKHLNKKYFIWIIVIISIVLYLILWFVFPIKDKTFIEYLKPISTVVLIDSLFVFCFVKWLWKLDILYNWLVPFPDLNGTWKGSLNSTWIDPVTNKRLDPIPVILTIKQSFISVSCVMKTEEMQSYSFASDFVIDGNNQILRLIYNYNSTPKQTIRDRSSLHTGTMNFMILNEKKILEGEYWTNRKTTGEVKLMFWKKEYIDLFPEELGNHIAKSQKNELKKDL